MSVSLKIEIESHRKKRRGLSFCSGYERGKGGRKAGASNCGLAREGETQRERERKGRRRGMEVYSIMYYL